MTMLDTVLSALYILTSNVENGEEMKITYCKYTIYICIQEEMDYT